MTAFADFGIDIPPGRSGEVDTLCPQCSHSRKKSRHRCLSVNTDKGTWHCAHCGWSGGLGGGQHMRDGYGASPPKPREFKLPTVRVQTPDDVLREKMLAWFAGRGIPAAVVDAAGITIGREWCPELEREVNAICYPYVRDGVTVNYKFRSWPKYFWMSGGAERILYGLDGIGGAKVIIVVEGEMDQLSLAACGFAAVVSVPDGAPTPETRNYTSKFAFLAEAEADFAAAETVVIAVDMDAPGNRLAEELARRFGPEKCKRVLWPEKDANDTLVKHGAQAVKDAIADAQPFPVAGLFTPRELATSLEALYERGLDKGVGVGWPKFDTLCRARPGLLAIVTGTGGAGKSHWLDNWLVRLADQHGWTFAICSPENQPLERHLAGLLAVYLGKPFGDGPVPRMTRGEMQMAREWAERHFTFILPEEPTLTRILELADIAVYRSGISGLVIDPWNELDHTRPPHITETEHVSQSLTTLRNWSRARQCMSMLVAHPTKLQKTSEGKYPIATLFDISGSAKFQQKADIGLSVWRNPLDTNEPTQVHVQKIRFSEMGTEGVCEWTFDRATGRLRELGQPIAAPREMDFGLMPWEMDE